jgi:hypothetical protein
MMVIIMYSFDMNNTNSSIFVLTISIVILILENSRRV